MQEFVLKLKGSSAEEVSLSPLPANLRFQQSPRKISKNHCLYVTELQTNEILQSSESISYSFNSSPMQVNVSIFNNKKIDKTIWNNIKSNSIK